MKNFSIQSQLLLYLCTILLGGGYAHAKLQYQPTPMLEAPTDALIKVKVENFDAAYQATDTPQGKWNKEQEKSWILGFKGELSNQKEITYRGTMLPVGDHDMWIEAGKGEWLYLVIGNKNDSELPRLRAMFRLYEQEKGVSKTQFKLKLTRKSTKLKFSIFAGKSEGHGNLRIVEPAKEE